MPMDVNIVLDAGFDDMEFCFVRSDIDDLLLEETELLIFEVSSDDSSVIVPSDSALVNLTTFDNDGKWYNLTVPY